VNRPEIFHELSQCLGLTTKLIAFAKLIVIVWRWLQSRIARFESELMTIVEAAAYAGVSSSKIRRVAKLHPEMAVPDGNGRNPHGIRREVRRHLKMAPKRAKQNTQR